MGSLGNLKMNQKLKLLLCYWNLALYIFESIKEGFKCFYCMIAFDLTRMQSLNYRKSEIDDFSNCVIESLAVWELIMPTRTNNMQVHELADLAPFIPLFGPLMLVSEFPGERMLGMVKQRKKMAHSGGLSFGRAIMRRQISHESRRMKSAYSQKISDIIKDGNGRFYIDKNSNLIYNDTTRWAERSRYT